MKKDEKKPIPEDEQTGVTPAAAGQDSRTEDSKTEDSPAAQVRMSWEDILADPEYKRSYDEAVRGVVMKRLRGRADAEERLRQLDPLLSALSERYGVEDSFSNAGMLAERILAGAATGQDAEGIRAHLAALISEAEALRESFPDFDLLSALDDPALVRLTAPHTGVTLSDAYYALHRDEIGKSAARQSLEALSRSLASSLARPHELSERSASGSFTPDPRSMSKQERQQLRKRIYEAAAQGKRIMP